MGRPLAETFPTFARWSGDPRTRAAWRLGRRGAGAIAGATVRTLAFPPVIGILYFTSVTYLSLRGPMLEDDENLLGSSRAAVTQMVWARYSVDVEKALFEVLALSAVLGAVLGAVAGAVVALASWWERRTPSRPERAAWTLAVSAVIQGGTFAWSMARDPQIYERTWNHVGGARRWFQSLVSDRLGPGGVLIIAVALLGSCAIVPPLLRRARKGWGRARGPSAAEVAALVGGAAALMGLATPFALLSPRAPRGARVTSDRPNVLLLAADSLRDDRVEPSVMPVVSRLAAAGTRFTRAYVSLPRTLPSWTTLLTGLWAHHHGIRTTFPDDEARTRPLDTIVSRFAAAGYRTSVVTDYAGDAFATRDFGFQEVVAPPPPTFREYIRLGVLRRAKPLMPFLHSRLGRWLVPSMRELPFCSDAGFLAADVIDAIERADRPFFMLGFFGAPHYPYASPSPYFKRFADPEYDGDLKYDRLVWKPEGHPSDAEMRQLHALYDGAVASFDEAVARVLRELARAGIADRTLVVILADHGESLLEAGRVAHGNDVAGDEALHIPLVVFDPRAAEGRSVRDLVRDVDLAPTLCDLAGVPCPAAMDGASFADALRGQPLERRLTYAETGLWLSEDVPGPRLPYPPFARTVEPDTLHDDTLVIRPEYAALVTTAKHRAVFDGRWKLVYIPTPEGPRYALFDAIADPLQTTDASDQHPAEAARLHQALWAWMLQDPRMEDRHGWLAPRGVPIAYVDGDGLR